MSRKFDRDLESGEDETVTGCFYYDFGHGIKLKETVAMRKKLENWRYQRRRDGETICFKEYLSSVFSDEGLEESPASSSADSDDAKFDEMRKMMSKLDFHINEIESLNPEKFNKEFRLEILKNFKPVQRKPKIISNPEPSPIQSSAALIDPPSTALDPVNSPENQTTKDFSGEAPKPEDFGLNPEEVERILKDVERRKEINSPHLSDFGLNQTPEFVANPPVALELPKFDFQEVETPEFMKNPEKRKTNDEPRMPKLEDFGFDPTFDGCFIKNENNTPKTCQSPPRLPTPTLKSELADTLLSPADVFTPLKSGRKPLTEIDSNDKIEFVPSPVKNRFLDDESFSLNEVSMEQTLGFSSPTCTLNLRKSGNYKSPLTIMKETYGIRPIEESDLNGLPSYLKIENDITSRLNKVLFDIAKLANGKGIDKSLVENGRQYFLHLTKLKRIKTVENTITLLN